nr:sugar phosphate isomerase/epimerase [Chloroflexota bacterium]
MFKTSMSISPQPANFAPLLFAGYWELGIEKAAELGYDAVELSLLDPSPELLMRIADMVRQKGLSVAAVATGQSYYTDGLSLTNSDPAVQAKLLDRMKRFIDFLAPWQGCLIIGGVRGKLSAGPAEQDEQRQQALAVVRSYAEYARSTGVCVAIEPINRYETNFLNTIAEALSFADEVGLDNVVILADTFHMNIEEVSLAQSLELAGERLGYVHLVDSNRRAPGQGHLCFAEVVSVLRKIGFKGYINAEILPWPDSETAAKLAIDYFHSL